ncbi:RNA-directed DNA polymerase, eukaryota [Tanacetum coccineum]
MRWKRRWNFIPRASKGRAGLLSPRRRSTAGKSSRKMKVQDPRKQSHSSKVFRFSLNGRRSQPGYNLLGGPRKELLKLVYEGPVVWLGVGPEVVAAAATVVGHGGGYCCCCGGTTAAGGGTTAAGGGCYCRGGGGGYLLLLSDIDGVSDTVFDDKADSLGHEHTQNLSPNEKENSSDPFNLYNLLNKRDKGEANSGLDSSIPFPPGFTPEREFQHVDAQEGQGMENSLSKRRSEGLSSRVLEDAQPLNEHASPSIDSKKKAGGSILEVIDDMIKVGQSMGFTMEGCLGSKAKKDWIKELNNKHKVNFLSVQETKLDCISDMDVKVLWGNYKFEYTISEAVRNSGGILWAPQSITSKRSLWSYISSLISCWDGHCIVMGDFNEVRCMEDRLGSVYNAQSANEFNSFISNLGLIEIQLEGYSFTWSLQSAKKMSKLDRFFVSDGLLSLFPHLSGICLDRHLSDHRPILLREVVTDYGPSPFRVYHSWFSFTWEGSIKLCLENLNRIDLGDKNKEFDQ